MENKYQTNQTNPNQQIINVAQLEQMFHMFQQMNKQNKTKPMNNPLNCELLRNFPATITQPGANLFT